MPLGFWVRMETYTAAPFVDILEDHDGSLTSDVTKGLVFIEARTSDPFKFFKSLMSVSYLISVTSTVSSHFLQKYSYSRVSFQYLSSSSPKFTALINALPVSSHRSTSRLSRAYPRRW